MSVSSMRVAALSGVMREAILQLCRANVSYSGSVEVDGIICISGQEEGQQIVVKVHEQLFPEKDGCLGASFGSSDRSPEGPSLKRARRDYSPLQQPESYHPLDAKHGSTTHGRDGDTDLDRERDRECDNERDRDFDRERDRDLDRDRDSVPYVKTEDSRSDRNGDQSDGETKSEHVPGPLLDPQRAAIDLTTHGGLDTLESTEHLGLMAGLAESRLHSMYGKGTPLRPHALMPFLPRRPLFQNALFLPAPSPECKACGVFIADPELLQEHNETHHGVFTCRVCYRTFTSRSNLERHSRLHTGHKPYICSKCGKAFSRKDHLTNHSAKHAYKCGKCLKRFVERDALRMHYRNDHQVELSSICSQCNKGFADARLYAEHLKSHPESTTPKVPMTPEEYEMKAAMFQFKCTECGLTYSDAIDLARHRHMQHMLYSCLSCFKSFADPVLYSQHFVAHQGEMNIFECYACRQICQTYSELREHEQVHLYGPPNPSSQAPSTVPAHPPDSPSDVDVEEDADTYLCPYCAKVFSNKPLLMEHVSIHEGLSHRHACLTCGERFESSDLLSRHERADRHGPFYPVPQSPATSSHHSPVTPEPSTSRKSSKDEEENNSREGLYKRSLSSGKESSSSIELKAEEKQNNGEHIYEEHATRIEDRPSGFVITDNPTPVIEVSIDHRDIKDRERHPDLSQSMDEGELSQEQKIDVEKHEEPKEHAISREWEQERERGRDIMEGQPALMNSNSNGPDWFPIKNHHSNFMVPVPVPSGGFLCSICGLRFIGFKEYESHCFASHYRYPCMYCPKTFAQRPNRDRHICIHTGERPFTCPECGQKFSRGDKLKLHRIKSHHLEYPGPYVRLKDAAPSTTQSPTPAVGFVAPGHMSS